MISQFLCLLLISLLTLNILNESSAAIVKVKQGLISGSSEILSNGKVIQTFIGVPYAAPPIGKRRFKDPEPLKSWFGVWNATFEHGELMKCLAWMHVPGGPNTVGGHEDCLYLNIYTPKIPVKGDKSKLLDVIFYIHGGAFMFGTGLTYTPYGIMARHDLVYISINYRLGPLGFLSTGDSVVPGNMGLKDQTEALKWVKENIAQFGGNPNSITISGMSAGGASVHFQMLSPLNKDKGLFHRAISMSGTALCPWTVAENLPEKTKFIANELGCPTDTSEKMIECLQRRPATLIVNAVRKMQPFMYSPFSPFGPTIDIHSKNPILPDYPKELLKQGKVADVPWLDSVTTSEGLYPAAEILVCKDRMATVDKNWNEIAPHLLDYNFTVSDESMKTKIAEQIRFKYLQDKPISKENSKSFVKLISDRMFYVDAERAARFQAAVNKAPIYFYEFNFRGRYSLSNHYAQGSLEHFGVSHGDDTQYVIQYFGLRVLINAPEEESKMVDFMSNLWASFAKTGKPHISSWEPVTQNSFNYLKIDSAEDYKMIHNAPEIGSRSFWDSLPFEEYNVWESSASVPHQEL